MTAAPALFELPFLLPLLLPLVAAMALLLLTTAGGPERPAPHTHHHLVTLTLMTLLASAWAATSWLHQAMPQRLAFVGEALVLDGLAAALTLIVFSAAFLGTLLAAAYLSEHGLAAGEYLALLLLSTLGAVVTVTAGDLLVLFLGIELMSLPAYVMAGYRRAQRRSQEAALKYFLFGAVAASCLVMGLALLWGEVGRQSAQASLTWKALATASQQGFSPLGWAAIALVLAGLFFKIAAVPFHMWAPDVYEGAPTPAAAFLSTGIKVAGMGALCRVVLATLAPIAPARETVVQLIELVAILSMVLGNVLAVRQVQLKRLLGCSSIAHVGYLLVGLAAHMARSESQSQSGLLGVVFYLSAYVVMGTGTFAAAQAFERGDDRRVDLPIERLAGAGRRHPAIGLALAISLLGLAGIPPMAGFVGKWALFGAAVASGRFAVVAVAAVASVVGAYSYLRIIAVMFMRSESTCEATVDSPWLNVTLWLASALTVALGIFPDVLLSPLLSALSLR